MEEISRPKLAHFRIHPDASKANLWVRPVNSKTTTISYTEMLPEFKITAELLNAIWVKCSNLDSRRPELLRGYKYSSNHYLSIKFTSAMWQTRCDTRDATDITSKIYLTPSTNLSLNETTCDKIHATILRKLNRLTDSYIEPTDLCKLVIVFHASTSSPTLFMKGTLIYPKVSLTFSQMSSVKLVSTRLSRELISRKLEEKVQMGVLTMDQEKRALPLNLNDPQATVYPLVGIWVSGVPGDSSPVNHPLVWSACLRYLQMNVAKEKISPNPRTHSFLLIIFTIKPKFYEVSTVGDPIWHTLEVAHEVEKDGNFFSPVFFRFSTAHSRVSSICRASPLNLSYSASFSMREETGATRPQTSRADYRISFGSDSSEDRVCFKENFGSESSGQSLRCSSESLRSAPVLPSTEQMILEQSKVLKHLEQQIKELQSQILLTERREKEREKLMVSSGTNTTICPDPVPSFRTPQHVSSHSSTFQFQSTTPRHKRLTTLAYPERDSSLFSTLTPRYSIPSSSIKETEMTFYVPKIMYEDSSESSEEEEIAILEKRYYSLKDPKYSSEKSYNSR
jgi:hypothetical protein